MPKDRSPVSDSYLNQRWPLAKIAWRFGQAVLAICALGFLYNLLLPLFPRELSKNSTTTWSLPESVGRMVESVYEELTHSQAAESADLLPNASNDDGSPTANCLENMVGTRRLELLTSTVSRPTGGIA
jgi:hypothetical protein